MTPDEAQQAALMHAPRLSEGQARRLAKAVHSRPIAIAHACGYLEANRSLDIDQFIEALKARTALVLGSTTKSTEQNLRLIYEETLGELRATEPLAATLLGFLAFLEEAVPDQMRRTSEGAYILMKLGMFNNPPTSAEVYAGATACVKAEDVLIDRFLIDRNIITTAMHPLTASILRDILAPEREVIRQDLHKIAVTSLLIIVATEMYAHPELKDIKRLEERLKEMNTPPEVITELVERIANFKDWAKADIELAEYMRWALRADKEKEAELIRLVTGQEDGE